MRIVRRQVTRIDRHGNEIHDVEQKRVLSGADVDGVVDFFKSLREEDDDSELVDFKSDEAEFILDFPNMIERYVVLDEGGDVVSAKTAIEIGTRLNMTEVGS